VKGTEAVTVDKVARAVDLSASHLAHAFREQTGLSVLEFLGRLRVEVAKILLVTTDAKLADVATLTGFFDAGHLARVFRRRAGASPGSYRLKAG
jgi:transcriptional regulator GlxA family with amidase domain